MSAMSDINIVIIFFMAATLVIGICAGMSLTIIVDCLSLERQRKKVARKHRRSIVIFLIKSTK